MKTRSQYILSHLVFSNVLILTLLLFKLDSLSNLIKSYWVEPIAKRISDEPISILSLGILLAIFSYYVLVNRSKIYLILTFYFITIFTILTIRTASVWEINNNIATLIVLAIVAFVNIALFLWYKTSEQSISEIKINDDFGRRSIAKNLISNLTAERIIDESFNFALIGEWGSGKTHVFKFIESELVKLDNFNKTIHLIKLLPWQYSDHNNLEEKLILSLSKTTNKEINNIFEELLHLFYEYNSNFISKTVGYFFSHYFYSPTNPKTRLKEFLKENKIIILMDDIDRLEGGEIRNVLKLMRNILNYQNIHFGLGFDIEYLRSSLFETDSELYKNPFKYLDKFFQLKIYLPIIDDLKQYLLKTFKSEFPYLEKSRTYELISNMYNSDSILRLIETPRDVKNIIYSSKQHLIGLENDSDLFLIILLETLKLKDNQTYLYLRKNKKAIPYLSGNLMAEQNEETRLREEVRSKAMPLLNYSKFSRHPITDEKYLNNYFGFNVGEQQISNKEFEELLNITNQDLRIKKFKEKIDEGLGKDVFQKLSWKMEDSEYNYNESNIKLAVDIYSHYQGEYFMPYTELVDGIIKSKEKSKNLDILSKVTKNDYYYNLLVKLAEIDKISIVEITNLLEEIIKAKHKKNSKVLLNALNLIYTSSFYRNSKKSSSLYLEIGKLIEKYTRLYPYFMLSNFIVKINEPNLTNGDPGSYAIYSKYYPEQINFSQLQLLLNNKKGISKIDLDENSRMDLIKFINAASVSLDSDFVNYTFKHYKQSNQ